MTDPTPMNESPIMEEENATSGTNNNEMIEEGGVDNNNNNNNIDGNNNTITPQLLHHPATTGSVSAPTSPSHTTRVQHHRIPGKHHTTTNTVSPRQPHRPLSTYTNFGSPIHRPTGRLRSVSLGGGGSPHPYTGGAPTHHHQQPPPTFSVGNPQASGMICMPHLPFGAAPPVSLCAPPEISDQRKAMEAAAAAERTRAKQLEEEEREYTADQLRAVLKKERLRTSKIQADLASLRSCTVQQQLQAEVLEEGRINGLMRKLDVLQEEKGRIILELEREEEMLTNTLQKKLNEVRREKSILEDQIEREKKTHMILQNQLTELRNSRLSAASMFEEEEEIEEEA